MQSGRGYGESPLIDGDKLLCTPGGEQAMVVALNKFTGRTIWQSRIPELGTQGRDGAGFSSIVISNGGGVKQYVQLVGRGLVSFRAADGQFLWGHNAIANRTANIPTPVAHGDYVFSANGYNAGAVLLKLHAAADGGVRAEQVYALSGARFQNHHGGYVLLNGFIFGGHGSNNGLPTCVELQTGRIAWKRRGPGTGSAAVLYADGHLYFKYQDGVVALIEANSDEFRLKGKFRLSGVGGDSWAHPALADGILFLRDKVTAVCFSRRRHSRRGPITCGDSRRPSGDSRCGRQDLTINPQQLGPGKSQKPLLASRFPIGQQLPATDHAQHSTL